MTIFEKELRNMFGSSEQFKERAYSGKSMVAKLDDDLRVKMSFVTLGVSSEYPALRVKVINRTEGEVDSEAGMRHAVCGIGVNLFSRSFPPELADIVTTVEDNIREKPDREALIAALTDEFFSERADEEIMKEYRQRSLVIGQRVEVRAISGESFDAFALDITDSGALLVKKDDGSEQALISAEVSLKINQNKLGGN